MRKKKNKKRNAVVSGVAVECDNNTAETLWHAQDFAQMLGDGEKPVIEGEIISENSSDAIDIVAR